MLGVAMLAWVLLLLASIGGDPFRRVPFEDAHAAARSEKKLLVIDFFSAGSDASRRLEKLTLQESRVRSFLADKVVAIRADLGVETELARRFGVDSAPAIVFVDSAGTEIDRLAGYVEPMRFLAQSRSTLEGKDALFRLRARVAADAKSWRLHLELARTLLARGLHPEALEELLRCFDHGPENDPSFADARSGEVLDDIHQLGQAYPAALEELARRSDAAAKRILGGTATPRDVEDVIGIDGKLGRSDHLAALYDALRERPDGVDVRRRLGPHVVVVLLADQRYAEALECIGDPWPELAKRISACDKLAERGGPEGPVEVVERCRREVVWVGTEYFEILLGAGRSESAAALVDRILAFEPKVGTYERLMEHAVRAGASKTAAEIGRRGVASDLSKADKARLRIALSGLPER